MLYLLKVSAQVLERGIFNLVESMIVFLDINVIICVKYNICVLYV